jgi:hypothetical protein
VCVCVTFTFPPKRRYKSKGKGKVVPLLFFNWVPCHKGILGECTYGSTHSLTSALDGFEWSASCPSHFTPRERAPDTHWIGGWVGPHSYSGHGGKEKNSQPLAAEIEPWNPDHPVRTPVSILTELSRLLGGTKVQWYFKQNRIYFSSLENRLKYDTQWPSFLFHFIIIFFGTYLT